MCNLLKERKHDPLSIFCERHEQWGILPMLPPKTDKGGKNKSEPCPSI